MMKRLIALDLLAQAEHGDGSLAVAVSDDRALLDAVGREIQALFEPPADRHTAGRRCSSDAPEPGRRARVLRGASRPST